MTPSWLEILILSVVEGITEFLPVSSTGHMIITSRILGLTESPELQAFLVIVQAGAILAVVTAFWSRFMEWLQGWWSLLKQRTWADGHQEPRLESLRIALSVVPFAIVGFFLKDFIDTLFSVPVVASALIVGGVLMLAAGPLLDRWKPNANRDSSQLGWQDAIVIGIGQCLALWPGFSRSAATIITSRFCGFSQGSAAELSFLIGLPTLLGAAGYKATNDLPLLLAAPEWLAFLGVGIVVSWIVAYGFVKWFLAYLRKHSLNAFAWYRIVVGIGIFVFFL